MINDSNEHLINVYRIIREQPQQLIGLLYRIQEFYQELAGYDDRKEYFQEQRTNYNDGNPTNLVRAALFMFFMRACYNAIYSVNKKGKLSLTFGNYKRTNLLDSELI